MKQLLLVLTALVLLHQTIQAQSVATQMDTAFISGASTDLLTADNHVINNSASTYNLRWTRYEISMPTGWETTVCDKNNCYAAATSTKDFVLNPNESAALLKVNFIPNGVNGTGLIKLNVTATDASGINFDSYFVAQAYATGVSTVREIKDIFMYPTPVRENVYVLFNPNLKPNRIDVFNVLGQKIKTFPVQIDRNTSRVELPLSELDKGMYFIRVYQEGSSQVITKQFTKE